MPFRVTLLPSTDITSYVQKVEVDWPAVTDLPTAKLTLNNQGGEFATGIPNPPGSPVPFYLYKAMTVELPNGVGPFYFKPETIQYDLTPQKGHTVDASLTAAPELTLMSDGNTQVVGTDLFVYDWVASPVQYVPYPSDFIVALGTSLIDIGTLLTSLLHSPHPGQASGYRGRLGYDCTGLGVRSSDGVDYTNGLLTRYIKAQWKIGQGSTGAQKTGLDIVRDVCQNNVIDGTGTPDILDFYVDMRTSPPLLKVFSRGSVDSGQTIVAGSSPIHESHLPVDAKNVRNAVLYWSNSENTYPANQDAWSNYDTTPQMLAQWGWAISSGTGSVVVGSDTPSGAGTSIEFDNSSLIDPYDVYGTLNLPLNGYRILGYPVPGILSSFNFWFKRAYADNPRDSLIIEVQNVGNMKSARFQVNSTSSPAFPVTGSWGKVSVPIPSTGLGGWGSTTGWDWGVDQVANIYIEATLGAGLGFLQQFFIDYVYFGDSWNFSPTYSYNPLGPNVTKLSVAALSGDITIKVDAVEGLLVGQYLTVGFYPYPTERAQIAGFEVVAGQNIIDLVDPLTIDHYLGSPGAPGVLVIGALYDPNSIAAYGGFPRIFNYVDFYLGNGSSQSANAIGFNVLNARKAKSSSGTVIIDGHDPAVPLILPGSRFVLDDPKDTYVGDPSVDSAISGWIADSIKYEYAPDDTGFRVTYTVEPYYSTIIEGSPDRIQRDLWAFNNRRPAGLIGRLTKSTQLTGVPRF